MGKHSASAFVLLLLLLYIAAATGDGEFPPVGTPLCSQQVYTAADSFAADIDLVLKDLPGLDSEFLPTIDVNVYSPNHHHPVAYGQRICTDDKKIGVICEPCFADALSGLVTDCRNNHLAGGQITLKSCFMRCDLFTLLNQARGQITYSAQLMGSRTTLLGICGLDSWAGPIYTAWTGRRPT
ncbi:unnamed protein product [Linum trigynum]|uniref:Gnk2-homologous domain-containing protein n=1 Tax=Linum trigynum TaxID=586398 RepID=A0AAV2DLS1_9ROSI